MEKRRLAVLLTLAFAASTIKIVEDVFSGESVLLDREVLLFIHRQVPDTLTGFFEAATLTGSSSVLFPVATLCVAALLYARRRFEAMLIAISVLGGAAVVYCIKTAAGRSRPALWEAEWYWGSSFPSGHTLAVAAFATGGVLCVNRLWPAWRGLALFVAVVWVCVVALSRLVLGVHWPTDVLAAACIGAIVALAASIAIDIVEARPARRN